MVPWPLGNRGSGFKVENERLYPIRQALLRALPFPAQKVIHIVKGLCPLFEGTYSGFRL